MNTYVPQIWAVVRFTKYDREPYYKVLAGFWGSWRLSSQIISCGPFMDGNRIEFVTDTGSNYVCHPEDYGLNILTTGIFDNLKKNALHIADISMLDGENTDFINFYYGNQL